MAVCEISPDLLEAYLEIFTEKMPAENIIVLNLVQIIKLRFQDMFQRFSKIYNHNKFKLRIRKIILKYI